MAWLPGVGKSSLAYRRGNAHHPQESSPYLKEEFLHYKLFIQGQIKAPTPFLPS